MKIGLGVPITDLDGLLSWARLADEGPFSTLALLDRLVYDNPEPLVTLGALAGCTKRVRLQTGVLVAPLRHPVTLAKQVATLDRLSCGRFTLGLGVGRRSDDFAAAGADIHRRGEILDEQLAVMKRIWDGAGHFGEGGGRIGPLPLQPGGPEILFGGFAPAAIDRAARWGAGYHCAASLADTPRLLDTMRAAWCRHQRPGSPRMVGQVNIVLGDQVVMSRAQQAIRDYHAYLGPMADEIARQAVASPEDLRAQLRGFEKLGADEVILYCWSGELEQFARIADVVA
jgi:alkanesulfonate monooxygenase SsuD/methylene tetrahydromethanopterin reductase-like flavin-dependent oxidoreductase (luciferase family)